MKTHIALLALCTLILSSCGLVPTSLGSIAVVQNRDANGQYISPVSPVDGAPATQSATLYRFKSGDLGVSLWTGTGPLFGNAPNLRK